MLAPFDEMFDAVFFVSPYEINVADLRSVHCGDHIRFLSKHPLQRIASALDIRFDFRFGLAFCDGRYRNPVDWTVCPPDSAGAFSSIASHRNFLHAFSSGLFLAGSSSAQRDAFVSFLTFRFPLFLMSKKTFKCLNCGEMHTQDPRSKGQRFCHQDLCRRASHARSQRQWLSKPQNRDYFTGPVNTERARQWRKANPGYWRKRKDPQNKAQQDLIDTYLAYVEDVGCSDTRTLLQDFIKAQTAIMVGFASILTGSAQQDEIATILRSCLTRGGDVYGNQPEASQARRVQNTKAKYGNADKHRPPGP